MALTKVWAARGWAAGLIVAATSAFVFLFMAPPAHAATFTPACGDAAALQAAVTTSNSNGEDDTITLAEQCTYTISAELAVAADGGNSLTVNGGGLISGGDSVRVFNVASGADLILDQITVLNGFVAGDGSGILNAGTVTITDSAILDNGASSGNANGGGINNGGSMTLTNVTLS